MKVFKSESVQNEILFEFVAVFGSLSAAGTKIDARLMFDARPSSFFIFQCSQIVFCLVSTVDGCGTTSIRDGIVKC